MDWESSSSWIRGACLWLYSLYGVSLGVTPFLMHPGINLDQSIKIAYLEYMNLLQEPPACQPPRFATYALMEISMLYVQYSWTFLFFLVTVRTENFRVRSCQQFALQNMVLCPTVYLFSESYFDLKVGFLAYRSFIVGFVFALLGFGPFRSKAASVSNESSVQHVCERIISWIRGVYLWLWIILCLSLSFMMFLGSSIDEAVRISYSTVSAIVPNSNASLYLPPHNVTLPGPVPVFGKMVLLELFLRGVQWCVALLFFLATVRTEHFRVRCCQFLFINLTFLAPTYYLYEHHRYGFNTKEDAPPDIVCGLIFFVLGFIAPSTCRKAKETAMSTPLLQA